LGDQGGRVDLIGSVNIALVTRCGWRYGDFFLRISH